MRSIRASILTQRPVIRWGIAVAAVIATASTALAGPDIISVPGIVRDFHKNDAILATPPAAGNGHYARNVALTLSAGDRPVFAGPGFKVATQWRDKNSQNIASHLYRVPGGIVQVNSAPSISGAPTVDTFNSQAGAYGGGNVGPKPTFVPGSSMPAVAPPTNLPAFTTDVLYSGTGTSTLSNNLYCKTFTLQNGRILNITGNLFIYCTETFKIENAAKLVLLGSSTLHIYIGKDCTIQNAVEVNLSTWSPGRLTITNLGTTTMTLENNAKLVAQIISPNATLHIKNDNHFYGNFIGKSVQLDNTAGFHIDDAHARVCGVLSNDTAGAAGASSTGGIQSASAFDTWFNDTIGTNASAVHVIDLVRNASGVYEFISDAFFPIDNQIFGNEGQSHNYYYTFALELYFTHDACSSGFIEFRGADDCWIFVGNQLGIDLGGMVPLTLQRLDVDRLNLVDGQVYALRLFYAQRNSSVAQFHLRTNLDLIDSSVPGMVTAAFD